MPDLTRKRDRQVLKPRREPYWQRLTAGAFLGFRRGPDTWVARFRGKDGKQQYNALDGAIEFDEAKQRAEGWLSQLAGSPVRTVKRGSVKEALEAYLTDLRRHGRKDAAKEIEARYKLTVWNDPIADILLESASQDDFQEWRDRLTKGREARSVNRQARAVIAGLNAAQTKLGHVGNPATWRLSPLADDREDDGDTAVMLRPDQRAALIESAPSFAGAFLKALEHTGARPNELASARVADFDGECLKLQHRKGRPPKLRTRFVVLSDEGAAFFGAQVKGKLPGAWLFTEDGETQWRRHVWAREVRNAIARHNERSKAKPKEKLPTTASAYSFRHARISELLQIHKIDPLTVASQTGTSLAMIEKSYLKFIPSAMQERLRAVKAV